MRNGEPQPATLNFVPAAKLRGRIVVVGATAPSLQDVHPTSVGGGQMPGPEIQAAAMASVLAGFPLRQAGGWITTLAIILAGLVAPAASISLVGARALIPPLLFAAAYAVAAQLAFEAGRIIGVVPVALALVVGTVGALAANYTTELRERRRVREVFARFVPAQVADEVIDRAGGDLRLGGVQMEGTVMFCDLRGFTSAAESLQAAEVIDILNRYLTEMSEAILGHGGTVVSYMGDGIMAIFGAPIEQPDHAARAVAAAREMLGVRLPAFNTWMHGRSIDHEDFRMGIGLCSGPVMSGNVGSERRLEYTVVGDTTNTASRLEGMTKGTPHMLFVSDASQELTAPELDFLKLATDNCANPAVNCVPASGAAFPLGVTTVTCTATDAANNRATCSFTVTLTTCDIPPPPHVTVNVEQGQCAKTVTYSLPNTSGGCGAVTCTPAPGATFAVGVTTVSCESSDALGIKSSASFTVTVKDTQAPVIACPAPLRVLADGPSVVNYSAPVATDNCATPLVTCNPPANTTFPLGVTTVTCTATDGSGNTKTCDFPVTVTPCAITCPAPVTVNAATGQCAAVVNYPAPTVSGTCTATCVPPAGSTFVVGVTTVTCSVSDANNVASSCSFTVTVNDTQAPVPVCPANIVRANDAGQCQAVVNYPAPTVTDNCPGATISCTPASGAAFAKGVTTVTCTAKDTAGNTAQCSFTVTVNDTEPPKLACPANQTVTSNGPVAVIYSLPAATDNCAGVGTPVCLPSSGAIFPVGTTTVNCSVSDAANNTSTCSFVVQVKTCTLTCPEPLTVNTDAGQCAALVNYTMPATNGCGTVTCTPPPGSTFALGVTTVTCTASDPNVTPRTCSFTVTVNDRQAPTITCPANITRSADANACAAVVTYPNPNVSDNCSGGGTPVCAPASGSSFAIGTTTVTCTVRDAAQNRT